MIEDVRLDYQGKPEWFNGQWGTVQAVNQFGRAKQEQIAMGIHAGWVREAGRYITELLDEAYHVDGIGEAHTVARKDLAEGRPLGLRVSELREDEVSSESILSHVLVSVDPLTGDTGKACMGAISVQLESGDLAAPQDSTGVAYSEEQRVALHGLLMWQRANGLLVPSPY